MTDELNFQHIQTPEETLLLQSIVTRILSIPRMAVWGAFSAALTACIAMAATPENQTYAMPLALLSGFLTLGLAGMILATLRMRPRMLRNIRSNEGKHARLRFEPARFFVDIGEEKRFAEPYRCVIGQYWLEDYYILHIRPQQSQDHSGDELLPVPLTSETFDMAYALANALSAQKKNLVRLKAKKRKP